jgi:hypothetical protein
MPDCHCRIGRVTKKGGAMVRVLRPTQDGSAAEVIATLREHVDTLAEQFATDAAGYAVVMWSRAGHYSRGRVNAPSSPYAYRLIPAIVHDVLSQDTAAAVATDVLKGEW